MLSLSDITGDFLGIWPHILLSDALRYILAAGIAGAVVLWWGPAWLRRRKIQDRRHGRADLIREISASLLTVLVFSLNGFGIYLGIQAEVMHIYRDADLYGWLWLPASLILLLVAHDTYFYWLHRAMHHRWLYRRVHRLHHRSVTPTPFAAYAFHPLEAVLEALFLPLFLLLVPVHGAVVAVFLTVMIVRNVVGHAGHEIYPGGLARSRWFGWLASTTHHDMHHSRPDGNFGLYFTWWDRLMGTEHADYRDRFDAVTGRRPTRRVAVPAAGVVALLAMLGTLTVGKPARADTVFGRWVTPGIEAVVELAPCDGGRLCGHIVWLWDAVDDAGQPRLLHGKRILAGLQRHGAGDWRDGEAFNPDNGNTYRASVRMRGPDTLAVEGCLLLFCETQIWRRPDAVALALSRAHIATGAD